MDSHERTAQARFGITRRSQLDPFRNRTIHRFKKKPEVIPKRGLIALAVDTESNKHGERSGKASLSSDSIPGVSVSEELTD